MDQRGGAPLVLLAAGGTGGHLFPAQALAEVLAKRGVAVALATDRRAAHYDFPAQSVHVIPSATVRGRDPISLARTMFTLARGVADAYSAIGRIKPSVVVGFGGYPTVPPLYAATLRRVPTVLHEQNGVMGRANKFLAGRVSAIATGFAQVQKIDAALTGKVNFTGNPVRPSVVAASLSPYIAPDPAGAFRLVVFGGSQGAQVMSDVVPAAIETLDPALRSRLVVVQQARPESIEQVRAVYARLGVQAETDSFIADLPSRLAAAHLVVSRSGASTIAELAAIGRPAILVPLPHSLDQDQYVNAGVLEQAGGAIRIEQAGFTRERLAAELTALAGNPPRLAVMAKAAKSAGTVDAAERLADLVLRVAAG